jgi:hypothetical protein
MSIEKFLNDLEKGNQEKAEKLKLAEDTIQKKEAEEKDFLKSFNSFYLVKVRQDLINIKTKLEKKFRVEWDSNSTPQQLRDFEKKIYISPTFDSYIKTVTITLIGEATRKLVTLEGKAVDNKEKELSESTQLQYPIDEFIKLNIEDEIAKVLRKFFI